MTHTTIKTTRSTTPLLPPRRRGVAMLLVLGVIAMACVLGYAMLASASLQSQSTATAAATANAQTMAESGVNLALYYLQNPQKSPDYPTVYGGVTGMAQYERDARHWEGTPGDGFVDLGSPAVGSINVKVTRPDPANRWRYDILSLGRSPGSTVSRRVEASVFVNAAYQLDHAAMFTSDVTLTRDTQFGVLDEDNGDAYSNGGLSIPSGSKILGRGFRRKVVASVVSPQLGWKTITGATRIVPRNIAEIRNYLTYESPKGTARSANTLTQAGIGLLQGVTRLESTPSNPAGIHYHPGNFTLHTDAEVRGTLIVGGNLNVVGSNVRIRSASGYPALIVGGNINLGVAVANLDVDGLTWVGGRIDAPGIIPTMTIRGGLLVNGTSPIFLSAQYAKLRVIFDRSRTQVPDFSEVGRTPLSIKVLSWQGQ